MSQIAKEVWADMGCLAAFIASYGATVFGFTFAVLLGSCLSPWAIVCAGIGVAGVFGMKALA